MSARVCEVYDLGRVGYAEAEAAQERLVALARGGGEPDRLVIVEHPPVVTIGRSSEDPAREVSRAALEAAGIEVHEVSRGGRATYHGPGQVVGYPIFDLRRHRRDLHWYLRALEDALIGALDRCGVRARREEGLTGVWVGERKVASIGVAVRGWVTWHGFALNVDCDAAHWRLIDPCGLRPEQMASLADLPGPTPSRSMVVGAVVEEVGERFGLTVRRRPATELFEGAGF